jgi:hypothetical protein
VKFSEDNKGQIRIIEAFFASILILSSLALIPPETRAGDSNDRALYLTARHVLTTLDSDGSLSKLIENQNWTTLRKCVESSLPATIWFNLTVFDENMRSINEIQICSGSPINEKVVATEYICASSSREYIIYIIRLQLSTVT